MTLFDLLNWDEGQARNFKFIVPGTSYKKPVEITRKGERLWFRFPYSKQITEELKSSFENYRWHGYEDRPIKQWSTAFSQHNLFQILYLSGQNPYASYDEPLIKYEVLEHDPVTNLSTYKFYLKDGRTYISRRLYAHQAELVAQGLTRNYCILAADMGVGKTLAAISAMEASGLMDWMWVGPRSAIASVQLEFKKWKCHITPKFITYSGLQKHNEEWLSGNAVYHGLILDESSRAKNVVAKRTIAAQYLADAVRLEHGENGYVIEMSGSPAPKSPLDWYSQSKIAMPGFLKEGHVNKLKDRLAVIHQRESATGGAYPHLVTWRDDETKCNVCGEQVDHEYHDDLYIMDREMENSPYHEYQKSTNEVANLSKRLRGLVMVKLKSQCLDLPPIRYEKVYCEPTRQTLRAAKLLVDTCPSTIKALALLRQLSDGFQYSQAEDGREMCGTCHGTKVVDSQVYIGPPKTYQFLTSIEAWPSWIDTPTDGEQVFDEVIVDLIKYPQYFKSETVACPHCKGKGEVVHYTRGTDKVTCPKIEALENIIDQHDEIGRLISFGGFTGSVDICVETFIQNKWDVIRLDGRGVWSTLGDHLKLVDLLEIFQSKSNDKKIGFVSQPGAGGMGITLTASPTIVFYSNDFNAESRIQACNRHHRPGMNITLGATVIDLIHLSSDEYVLDNLQKKEDLQSLSMGSLKAVFKDIEA